MAEVKEREGYTRTPARRCRPQKQGWDLGRENVGSPSWTRFELWQWHPQFSNCERYALTGLGRRTSEGCRFLTDNLGCPTWMRFEPARVFLPLQSTALYLGAGLCISVRSESETAAGTDLEVHAALFPSLVPRVRVAEIRNVKGSS